MIDVIYVIAAVTLNYYHCILLLLALADYKQATIAYYTDKDLNAVLLEVLFDFH